MVMTNERGLHRGRDSGNDFFVPKILDIFRSFPFLLLLFPYFIPKRFQKRKYPLFRKSFLFGYQKYKSRFFSFPGLYTLNCYHHSQGVWNLPHKFWLYLIQYCLWVFTTLSLGNRTIGDGMALLITVQNDDNDYARN